MTNLVKRLREKAFRTETYELVNAAANRIENLESVTKDDAKWLATYHKWCEMNGCAPSSSDLISARQALENSQ